MCLQKAAQKITSTAAIICSVRIRVWRPRLFPPSPTQRSGAEPVQRHDRITARQYHAGWRLVVKRRTSRENAPRQKPLLSEKSDLSAMFNL